MTKVYGKCHEEIGAFNDTKYIVGMLDRVRLQFVCLFVLLLVFLLFVSNNYFNFNLLTL